MKSLYYTLTRAMNRFSGVRFAFYSFVVDLYHGKTDAIINQLIFNLINWTIIASP